VVYGVATFCTLPTGPDLANALKDLNGEAFLAEASEKPADGARRHRLGELRSAGTLATTKLAKDFCLLCAPPRM
jgi:hypothetical protein